MAEPSAVALATEAPRARALVLAVVAVQLLLSLRFFYKYVDVAPLVMYLLFVAAGLVACLAVLRVPWLLRLATRPWTFALGLGALFVMTRVAYPRADALREVGRGSDQDDCVRSMVGNMFALREPFSRGYFNDPCSTGPAEFLVYFPVQLGRGYFVVVPVLALLLGYWVLTLVTDPRTARLLSLSQLASWLFLELSASGSDLLVIGWAFAAAVVASRKALLERSAGLAVVGVVAYFLVAGSRMPLIIVTAGSLALLLVVFGTRALRIVVSVVVTTTVVYVATYAAAPTSFTPGHLIGKSGRILHYLGGGTTAPVLVLVTFALVVLLAARILGMASTRPFVRRHYFSMNLVLVTVPMVAVAVWDLSRRDYVLGAWEGLHYLYLGIPTLLALTAHRLEADAGERDAGSEQAALEA